MRIGLLCLSLVAFLFGCAPAPQPASRADSQASAALHQLFADEWSTRMRDDPLFATISDVHEYDDRLPAEAPADFDRHLKQDQGFQQRLAAISRASLSHDDQVNYDLFEFVLKHRIALAPFKGWRIPLTSDEGFYINVMRMASGLRMGQLHDYENYIARLHAIPAYFDQQIANLRQGMADGFTLPAVILPGVIKVMEGQQYPSAEKSPFWEPFTRFPDSISVADQERLMTAGRSAIEADAIPAYRKLLEFFNKEYLSGARQTIAASELPEGKAYYEALVRYFTNLEVTPDQVHEIGLHEVERIHSEMDAVMRQTGFKGDFAAFLKFLRTDPRFYAHTGDELLKDASYIAKQIDGKLPGYFGKLPRLPYSVQPVPAELAPNYTAGRYSPPPIGGNKGGEYWVNTFALEKRPLYALTALTLHEAVPGHHLQGSLGRELENVPPFRLDLYPHAFGEGWGLYSEKLGKEMGMYKTPYDEFGRLTYEMWRACRLVVDTGMHWKGWSRDRALEYLGSNTALSLHEVRTETDRYIAWPGQALAYKMGELKILELREKAHDALGERFDLRAFHDAVLENGGVPLPILETQIDEYIAAAQKK
ncbi:MAG TPA: DUF885 domain-containing protein [Steroidobacteraceae bacterium]|nr:DUF885 domain-containing protein [Steroidobacteraceae bacterium]